MLDRTRCASVVSVILGIGFVVGGVLLFILGDTFIESAVKKGCQLRQGTPAYDNWRTPPVPLRLSFHVFDLNDTEFLNGVKLPFVKQRGPFVYKEVRAKEAIEEYENGTISYRETRNYTFLPDESSESEEANITTMNLVYMALVNVLQTEHLPPIFHEMVGQLLAYNEKPTMQRTVKELLWGYQDPLLHDLKEVFPNIVPNDQVSVFNASVSEAGLNTYLIDSGIDVHRNETGHIKTVGNILRFNGDSSVSYWTNKYANMINGTDSTIWHPDATANDDVYIFSSDICRSLHLEYGDTLHNKFGIKNLRFVLPKNTFSNTPENRGFCLNSTTLNKTQEIQCLPTGLMSLRSCIKLSGSPVSMPLPIIASNPHFLDADSSVQRAVQGLQPDENIHRSYMDIEPVTGTVMNGSRRIQINLNVVNDSSITAISSLKPFVYPMIWLEEHAEIDQERVNEFRSKVISPMTILNVMKYLLIAIGAVLFIIAIALIIRSHHKTNSSGAPFPQSAADETSALLA